MRVGIIGTPAKPINLNSSGGTEVFCALLAQGLIKNNHEVYLFASEDSQVEGVKLIPVIKNSASPKKDIPQEEKREVYQKLSTDLLRSAKQMEDKLDVIHDNTSTFLEGFGPSFFEKPIVMTMHVTPPPEAGDNAGSKAHFVAISRSQQTLLPFATDLVYNGIDANSFDFNAIGGESLAWMGRVSPRTPKGLKEAVIVSNLLGKKLRYAAYISDIDYFKKEIKPLLTSNDEELGVIVNQEGKNELYGSARATLFPTGWEEPFGLVVTESMATGSPVIAFARGAMPELIEDGKTGFLVNPSESDIRGNWLTKNAGEQGLSEAIQAIYSMSDNEYKLMREAARKSVEENFTAEKMVNGYEEVYKKILNNS